MMLKVIPEIKDVSVQLRTTALLRIIAGCVLLTIYGQNVYTGYFLEDFTRWTFLGIGFWGLLMCFTVGIFTPFVTILIILTLPLANIAYATTSLGTAICIQFLFVILLSNAGYFYSIDKLILQRRSNIAKLLKKSYEVIGLPDAISLRKVYFYAFCSYALISFGALSYHLQDIYWISGKTVGILLTGAYTSAYYNVFREISFNFPIIFNLSSALIGFCQSLFQFFMFPLALFSLGRKFVLLWGALFFLTSLFLLQLSSLPYYEILLWMLIFLRPGKTKKIQVFFDDKCGFCREAISFLRFLNFNNSIRFVPLSTISFDENPDLDREKLLVLMGGTYKGKIYMGYDLYLLIVRTNPIYFILLPFFYLGKWSKLGYFIYGQIAKHRHKLITSCEVSIINQVHKVDELPFDPKLFGRAKLFYYACWTLYIIFLFPVISVAKDITLEKAGIGESSIQKANSTVKLALYHVGFDMPIVFNERDLLINEFWFTLKRGYNDKEQLVPILDARGGRMNYFEIPDILFLTNHGSDLLYFGTTLQFRRAVIHANITDFSRKGYGRRLVERIIELDRAHLKEFPRYYILEVVRDHSVQGYQVGPSPNRSRFKTEILVRDTIYPKFK